MAILSLVQQAHKLCASASSIKYLGNIKGAVEPTCSSENFHALFDLLNPAFLDALFIATAAENLLKAELLAKDFVVHIVDKNVAPLLKNSQDKRPLQLSDIRTEEGANWRHDGPFTINSLTPNTLLIRTIVEKRAYQSELGLTHIEVDALKSITSQRNRVHLLVNDLRHINLNVVRELETLKGLVNRMAISRCQSTLKEIAHLASRADLLLQPI